MRARARDSVVETKNNRVTKAMMRCIRSVVAMKRPLPLRPSPFFLARTFGRLEKWCKRSVCWFKSVSSSHLTVVFPPRTTPTSCASTFLRKNAYRVVLDRELRGAHASVQSVAHNSKKQYGTIWYHSQRRSSILYHHTIVGRYGTIPYHRTILFQKMYAFMCQSIEQKSVRAFFYCMKVTETKK